MILRGAIRSLTPFTNHSNLKIELHVKFVGHDFRPLLVRDVCSMKIWAEAFVNICRILCDYLQVPQVMRPADTPMLLQWSGALLLLLPIESQKKSWKKSWEAKVLGLTVFFFLHFGPQKQLWTIFEPLSHFCCQPFWDTLYTSAESWHQWHWLHCWCDVLLSSWFQVLWPLVW